MRALTGIVGAVLLAASASASASVWDFDYTDGSTVNVDGTLTTSDTLTDGGYLVTAITGTRNGNDPITTLVPPPTYLTYGFDNLLLPGPGAFLDAGGILFTTASGGVFNICATLPPFPGYTCGTSGYSELNVKTGAATAVTFTAHKLPEPATAVLVLAALGTMSLLSRRRKTTKV